MNTPKTKMFQVTATSCTSDRWEKTTSVRAEHRHEAAGKAIRRWYGRRAFWWSDSGLGGGWGQVMRRMDANNNTSVTDRVRLDVEEG